MLEFQTRMTPMKVVLEALPKTARLIDHTKEATQKHLFGLSL